MNTILVNKTTKTPEVKFDSATGFLEIEGRLIPENPDVFFEVLFNSIVEFNKQSPYVIRLSLDYYNTTSSKRLLHFFQKLDMMFQDGCNMRIIWEYETGDEDSMRDGEDYCSLLKIPFELKRV